LFVKRLLTQVLNEKNLKPIWLSYFGQGIETTVYGIFWPLFLFYRLGNLEKMGLLSSMVLFTSLLVLVFIGKSGERKEKGFFNFGVSTSVPNWIICPFLASFLPLFIIDALYQTTTMFVWIPVGALTYRWGRKKEKSFFIIRSSLLNLGAILALAVAVLVASSPLKWLVLFYLAIFGLILVFRFNHGLKKNR